MLEIESKIKYTCKKYGKSMCPKKTELKFSTK